MLRQAVKAARVGIKASNRGAWVVPRLMSGVLSQSKARHFSTSVTRLSVVDRLGEKVDTKIDQLSVSEYDKISYQYLEDLGDELDIISDDHPSIDFELSQGVLTLNTEQGSYVINRQPSSKQIWLSSPISGPNRYDMIKGVWTSLRDNDKLSELLSQELSSILNDDIKLQLEC